MTPSATTVNLPAAANASEGAVLWTTLSPNTYRQSSAVAVSSGVATLSTRGMGEVTDQSLISLDFHKWDRDQHALKLEQDMRCAQELAPKTFFCPMCLVEDVRCHIIVIGNVGLALVWHTCNYQ